GRVGIVQLLGLSRLEQLGLGTEQTPFIPLLSELSKRGFDRRPVRSQELFQIIWRGSFPALTKDPSMNRDLFYSSYVQTYLQRDVRDLAKVGDEMSFLRFLKATAARTGQLLNLADLAKDTDIAPNTAKSWLSILQTSGIVFLLEPYHNNLTKRLIKTPKLYFLDTGLCAWLSGWSSPETLEFGAAGGTMLETWMLTEILKSWVHSGKPAPFYFFRDKDKKEIDLIIIQDQILYPLEFKKSASPTKEDVRNFYGLDKLNQTVGHGGVICLCQQLLPLTNATSAIPVGFI
ncbi:MAG: DUF4143 domain-containing protein, partial [Candidatus Margulisiibacteriota bacterium]